MSWEDHIHVRHFHKKGQLTEMESDSQNISKYLKSIYLGAESHKLTEAEQDCIDRHKRYKFVMGVEYVWKNSITGEETVSLPEDFSTHVMRQLIELYKEDKSISELDLFDKYVSIYNNAQVLYWVMDTNPTEFEDIRKGKDYPYLIQKFRTLFDKSKYDQIIEYEEELTKLKEGVWDTELFKDTKDESDCLPKHESPNSSIIRFETGMKRFSRTEKYSVEKFYKLFKEYCYKCQAELLRRCHPEIVYLNAYGRRYFNDRYISAKILLYLRNTYGIHVEYQAINEK